MSGGLLAALGPFIMALQSSATPLPAAAVATPVKTALVCQDQRIERALFLIVDTSEGIDLGSRQRISAEINDLLRPGKGGATAVVLIYPSSISPYEPVQIAGECLAAERSFLDGRLLQSPKAKQQDAARINSSRVAIGDAAEKAMLKSQGGELRSPLVESIIYLSKRPEFLGAKRRDIYLYSDMRQHSENSTVYGQQDGPAYFKRSAFRPADLMGASLYVLRLSRDQRIPGDDNLRGFWDSLVRDLQGKIDWRE